jgi:branched-chain amino acid transport system ATP-binding protein
MSPTVLDIADLSSGYGEAIVLRNVSLSIRPGEIFALLGKNGMGKSTLLKTVLGFLPAKRGRIKLFGEDVTALPTHLIARIVGKRLSQKAGTLSGGEQKMLIVSRALLGSPRLMMIDEISEGLQPSMIQRLTEILLAERKRTGTAIFVVEQNVPFAFSMADRYAVLKIGEIADDGVAGDELAAARVQDQLRV